MIAVIFSQKISLDILPLEDDEAILFEILAIDCSTLFKDVRMFANHYPANVREEESSVRTVRICIGVRIFMMHSVISDPRVNRTLKHKSVEKRN